MIEAEGGGGGGRVDKELMRGSVGTEVGKGGEGGTDRLDAVLQGKTGRVGLGEELGRSLAIMLDLRLRRLLQDRVIDRIHVHCPFVCQVIKDIRGLLRRFPPLLPPKDQIDPLVQVLAHVLALQGQPMLPDKIIRIPRPRRQYDVVHYRALPIFPPPQRITVTVQQHLRDRIQFWHQLLHVRGRTTAAFP